MSKLAPIRYLEWGGSPRGGSTLSRLMGCAYRVQEEITETRGSTAAMRFGSMVHVGAAGLAWHSKGFDRHAAAKAIAKGFRRWERAGFAVPAGWGRGGAFATAPKRSLVRVRNPDEFATPADFFDAGPYRDERRTDEALDVARSALVEVRRSQWTPVAVEQPVISKRMVTVTVHGGPNGPTVQTAPVTTIADLLVEDRRGKLLMVDYKTTGRWDLSSRADSETAGLSTLQTAVHRIICADRGWGYRRLYLKVNTTPRLVGTWVDRAKAPRLSEWLLAGVHAPYRGVSSATCGGCNGRALCWADAAGAADAADLEGIELC